MQDSSCIMICNYWFWEWEWDLQLQLESIKWREDLLWSFSVSSGAFPRLPEDKEVVNFTVYVANVLKYQCGGVSKQLGETIMLQIMTIIYANFDLSSGSF